jgi:hypothetical protein
MESKSREVSQPRFEFDRFLLLGIIRLLVRLHPSPPQPRVAASRCSTFYEYFSPLLDSRLLCRRVRIPVHVPRGNLDYSRRAFNSSRSEGSCRPGGSRASPKSWSFMGSAFIFPESGGLNVNDNDDSIEPNADPRLFTREKCANRFLLSITRIAREAA